VLAHDDKGATSTWFPTIYACACQNGGQCSQPSNSSNEKFQVMLCTCKGYIGKLCETPLDACVVNGPPCFPGVECTDSPAPAGMDGYSCGSCPSGYTGDGRNCTGNATIVLRLPLNGLLPLRGHVTSSPLNHQVL